MADVTVFDETRIDRGVEHFVQDVPGDGFRYVRDAHGVNTVIIGGAVAYDSASGYQTHTGDKLSVNVPERFLIQMLGAAMRGCSRPCGLCWFRLSDLKPLICSLESWIGVPQHRLIRAVSTAAGARPCHAR